MMNALISCVYVIVSVILIGALLVIRKGAEGLVRWKDVLGLVVAIQLILGGFFLLSYSLQVYLLTGACLCATAIILMLVKNIHHAMNTQTLLLTLVGLFVYGPGFLGYNMYYMMNAVAIEAALKKSEELSDESKSDDDN